MDLRAVYGDKSACMFFDRFHRCIMDDFVLINAPLPRRWLGQTVDDISGAAPPNAAAQLERFVREYRQQLERLGISATPSDPDRQKAFDMATSGEVVRKLMQIVIGVLLKISLTSKITRKGVYC